MRVFSYFLLLGLNETQINLSALWTKPFLVPGRQIHFFFLLILLYLRFLLSPLRVLLAMVLFTFRLRNVLFKVSYHSHIILFSVKKSFSRSFSLPIHFSSFPCLFVSSDDLGTNFAKLFIAAKKVSLGSAFPGISKLVTYTLFLNSVLLWFCLFRKRAVSFHLKK